MFNSTPSKNMTQSVCNAIKKKTSVNVVKGSYETKAYYRWLDTHHNYREPQKNAVQVHTGKRKYYFNLLCRKPALKQTAVKCIYLHGETHQVGGKWEIKCRRIDPHLASALWKLWNWSRRIKSTSNCRWVCQPPSGWRCASVPLRWTTQAKQKSRWVVTAQLSS